MLPIYDQSSESGRTAFEQRLARLKQTVSARSDAAAAVSQTLADVAARGDAAVVESMRRYTDPTFDASRIRVSPRELEDAWARLEPTLGEAIEASIDHVRRYQRHILPRDVPPITIDGAELGLRYTPVDSVGLCVPGGSAVLFSTLIMLAVPAIVAGVAPSRISVMHPPPTRRGDEPVPDISPIVMAVCHLLGIERLYRIGGAAGVAALAYGTATVEPVDLVAGPGNIYTQLAKQQVNGVVGTDNGFYGPSEIVTIADAAADPRKVASDLLAQAEHDPGKCFLIAWRREVIDAILDAIQTMAPSRSRLDAIRRALAEDSCALLVPDESAAARLADRLAAEHVNLAVADPGAWLARLRHGGEFFLGDAAPVAAGDYYAGPSHCLPTGTTARFTSGVSVHTFLKRSGTVAYPQGMTPRTIDHIARLASAEGLDAHAESARLRSQ